MKQFESGSFGKTIIIELERGEKVIEGIEEALCMAGIKNAIIVSAVGSIKKLNFHRPTDMGESANDEFITIDAPMEIGSLTGSIIDGAGHYHIVAADTQNVYCGHLEAGTEVLYLLEIIIAELNDCNLERKITPENVKKLFVK